MTERAHAELRRFATLILNSFVAAMEERMRKGPVSAQELDQAAKMIENSPAFARMTNTFYRRIIEEATRHISRAERRDPFKRLIVHPMGQSFENEILSRDLLGGYFSFIHLILGDEVEAMTARCQEVVDELKTGEDFDWDLLYNDKRGKIVLWTVLMRIADSFKRFELRRDWLINLMQTRPQSVSVASNAFIPIATSPDDPPVHFGGHEFTLMMLALFKPTRNLSDDDRKIFMVAFLQSPELAFGALWRNIDTAAK